MERSEPIRARILVVDDDAITFAVVRSQALRLLQVEVEHAPSGQAALERCAREAFDLILVDTEMPGLDGHETTRQLRDLEVSMGRSRALVVALSSHRDPVHEAAAREAGSDDQLQKPIGSEALADLVERARRHGPAPSYLAGRPHPAVADIAREFVDELSALAASVRRALTEERWEDARRTGHRIRGTAGSLGLAAIADAAERLERSAAAADRDAAERALARLQGAADAALEGRPALD